MLIEIFKKGPIFCIFKHESKEIISGNIKDFAIANNVVTSNIVVKEYSNHIE